MQSYCVCFKGTEPIVRQRGKMFFILNHRNNIIVADKDFLNMLDVCDVATASTVIKSGEIKLDEYNRTLEIDTTRYHFKKSEICTLFGQGHMYQFDNETNEDSAKQSDTLEEKSASNIDNDLEEFFASVKNEYGLATKTDTIGTSNSVDATTTEGTISETHTPLIDDIQINENRTNIESMLADESDSEDSQAPLETKFIDIELSPTTTSPRNTDYSKIAKLVGVSSEEYKGFLDDFITEANRLIPTIKSSNGTDSEQALETLKEATQLLHLPHLTSKIIQIQAYVDQDTRSSLTDELASISTLTHINQYINNFDKAQPDTPSSVNTLDPFPSIEAVNPIVFDYDMHKAVTSLMLPETMIKEFLSDFVKQSKSNIDLIRDAYSKQDITTIKSIAHMLKGASSNLHIEPITQTLSLLESNNSINNVPQITELFAGQVRHLDIKVKS